MDVTARAAPGSGVEESERSLRSLVEGLPGDPVDPGARPGDRGRAATPTSDRSASRSSATRPRSSIAEPTHFARIVHPDDPRSRRRRLERSPSVDAASGAIAYRAIARDGSVALPARRGAPDRSPTDGLHVWHGVRSTRPDVGGQLRGRSTWARSGRYGCSFAGSSTEPSSCWWFSSSAMSVRPTAVAVPFSVCRISGEPSRPPHARLQPPRLVVGGVRARRQLAVAVLAREPHLDVVLLGGAAAQVARGDVHHAVGQLEVRDDLLLDAHEVLVLVPARLRRREAEHLDLVELVHAEHPAHVLAVRAGLAPEAGRVARVAQREIVLRRGSRPCGARRAAPRRSPPGTGRPRASRRAAPRRPAASPCRTSPPRAPSPAGSPAGTPCRSGCPSRAASARTGRTPGRPSGTRTAIRSCGPRARCRARPRSSPISA